jgi:FkbM family methyltransferase
MAVEPSPAAFNAITETGLISKMQAAVTDRSGTMPFNIASETTASSLLYKAKSYTDTIRVRALSLPELIKELNWPRVDLLKVDIEGAEIEMLAACPDEVINRIMQISIEFHDFCGITSKEDVDKTIVRLRQLGFWSVRMSRVGHQDTWLINRRVLKISTPELMFITYILRNWMGFKRVAARWLGIRSH